MPITVIYTFRACTPVFRGAFSIVKKAVHKQSGQTFAAKIINTRRLTSRGKQRSIVSPFLFPPSLPLSFSFPLSLFLSLKYFVSSHHHDRKYSTRTVDYHGFCATPCTHADLQKLEREARICRIMKHSNIGKDIHKMIMQLLVRLS